MNADCSCFFEVTSVRALVLSCSSFASFSLSLFDSSATTAAAAGEEDCGSRVSTLGASDLAARCEGTSLETIDFGIELLGFNSKTAPATTTTLAATAPHRIIPEFQFQMLVVFAISIEVVSCSGKLKET